MHLAHLVLFVVFVGGGARSSNNSKTPSVVSNRMWMKSDWIVLGPGNGSLLLVVLKLLYFKTDRRQTWHIAW